MENDVNSGIGCFKRTNDFMFSSEKFLLYSLLTNVTIWAGEGPAERHEGGLQGRSSQDPAQDHRLHRLQGLRSSQVGQHHGQHQGLHRQQVRYLKGVSHEIFRVLFRHVLIDLGL
jgi:hypothetical protein